jgi:hypothetical protein
MAPTSNKTQIRALAGKWAKAVRAKDMEGVLANHTDNIVMFDVSMPYSPGGSSSTGRPGNCFLITTLEGRGLLTSRSCESSPANRWRIATPL